MLRNNIRSYGRVLLAATALFVLSALTAEPARALTCQVTPDNIGISLIYNGATLTITGESTPGDDLIVKVSSTQYTDVHLKYKGKASGIFWMKLGTMEFKNVPNVYMLYSTGPLNNMMGAEARAANQIGYDAIRANATMERSDHAEVGPEWFDQFLKFKQKEKLYSITEGTVTRNGNQFKLEAHWPFQAPPETYNVQVLAVRNGQVVEQATAPITVAQVGMVKKLSGLAFNNAAVYGIMAIVIAMVAGFAVGAIFKKGGGSH